MTNDSTFTLYNGDQIPALGFGTWQIPNGDICYKAVTAALKCGYKHIDTALAYGQRTKRGKSLPGFGFKPFRDLYNIEIACGNQKLCRSFGSLR